MIQTKYFLPDLAITVERPSSVDIHILWPSQHIDQGLWKERTLTSPPNWKKVVTFWKICRKEFACQ